MVRKYILESGAAIFRVGHEARIVVFRAARFRRPSIHEGRLEHVAHRLRVGGTVGHQGFGRDDRKISQGHPVTVHSVDICEADVVARKAGTKTSVVSIAEGNTSVATAGRRLAMRAIVHEIMTCESNDAADEIRARTYAGCAGLRQLLHLADDCKRHLIVQLLREGRCGEDRTGRAGHDVSRVLMATLKHSFDSSAGDRLACQPCCGDEADVDLLCSAAVLVAQELLRAVAVGLAADGARGEYVIESDREEEQCRSFSSVVQNGKARRGWVGAGRRAGREEQESRRSRRVERGFFNDQFRENDGGD
eukprot:scaffold14405_cov29-Tisochrysis_lutea.AAC.1